MPNNRLKIADFVARNRSFFVCILCVALCWGVVLPACTSKSKKGDKMVAKVVGKYLYFNDIKHIFPKGCTREDSLSLAKLYINNWIETQLLLKKAELNLSDEQLNISDEIETYRTSLLIYKYEDQLLQDKLDTVVSNTELQSYYEANTPNFLLDEYVVKATFIKIPTNAPRINDVKRWYMSDQEKDIQELTQYCNRYASKYNYSNDDWVRWIEIENELPQKEAAAKQITQYNRIEQQDNGSIYLVRIKEKRAPGEVTPLEIIKDRVKNIIINKRKLKFISELEKNIYNDALVKKQFEIYDIN